MYVGGVHKRVADGQLTGANLILSTGCSNFLDSDSEYKYSDIDIPVSDGHEAEILCDMDRADSAMVIGDTHSGKLKTPLMAIAGIPLADTCARFPRPRPSDYAL